jgi:HEAT repeat protein
MLKSRRVHERIEGATLLARIGPEAAAALSELERAMGDDDERVKAVAAEALAALGPAGQLVLARVAPAGGALLRQAANSGPSVSSLRNDALAALEGALRDPSPDVRAEAFLDISPRTTAEAESYTEPLIRGMHDPSPMVQEAARRAYGRLSQTRRTSNTMLVEILRRGDAASKAEAAWQLGMPRVPREYAPAEITALTEALSETEPRIRIHAARALVEAGAGVDVTKPVREALAATTDPQARMTAARVLWQATRRSDGIVEIVEQSFSDPDRYVRRDAIALTVEMGAEGAALRPALERLQFDSDSDIAGRARRALSAPAP